MKRKTAVVLRPPIAIGGVTIALAVFIEDVVLVTGDGAEVLTDMLPRSTAGLEKLMEAK
ncbi:MAG: hypothetical protein V3U22_04215 [Vicinamibacteria bacterium]